jgi:hypothetical protein
VAFADEHPEQEAFLKWIQSKCHSDILQEACFTVKFLVKLGNLVSP